MTPDRGPDRPGPRRPAARLAEPWAGRPDDGGTGPLPVVGAPAPPAADRSAVDVPAAEQDTAPATAEMAVPTAEMAVPPAEAVPVPADPPKAGGSRAGRNLVAAIGVGLALGALVLASLLIYRPAFLLVIGGAILLGVVELTRALRAGDAAPPLVPVMVGTVAMFALAWTRGPTGLVVGFLLTVLAVLLWRLGDGPEGYLRDATTGVLVALYVPLLAGFCVLLLVPDDGATRVLLFIGTVVGNDVGGYTAGVLFGKHPMAPSVSPKKSWEGMAGSVLACVAVATPVVTLALDGPWWGGVLFGVALAVTSTLGDLGESLIKRDLGIKDMGTLLPGHGGIMDRLDSLLPSAVAAYLLLSWVAPA
ncbi:phosphatidate cytidylyltransferase [Blastococcus sp. SYSU D00820]